ncbi:B12-binding domain-containing radical SAM protein [Streptomyces sp. NRRL WC-3742]|uniref:B12-binding domain-containing radical SAM protein n=1 Tax=Streptomyces sp. NRRL WC-3742 TaxID=1463934 RepID=UPI0004CBFA44|nr:radical SAM protein [Streptomyces sp. NRRL WC-3742]
MTGAGLHGAAPDGHPAELVRAARRERIARDLYEHEKDWRLHPFDGLDPREVSDQALARELALELTQADSGDAAGARHRRKHFPVLFVSAPHVEEGATGSFPGIPTPLLYATSVLDRQLRIDEFPAARVPEVVGVMNPLAYSPAFEAELIRCLKQHRPALVGISNLSEGHHFALRIACLVKEFSPDSLVLLGGQHEDAVNARAYRSAALRVGGMDGRKRAAHAQFDLTDAEYGRLPALQTLAEDEERETVDLVFAGEAPFALAEVVRVLAEHLDEGIEGVKRALLAGRERFARLPGTGELFLYDRDTERIESVELSGAPIDGNEIPFIDLTRLTHENRFSIFGNRLTAQVMAAIGCKYSCSFCHESADAFLYNQPKMRQRTPENVVKEIALRREQGFEAVFFDDSTFTQNPRWLAEFLELLRKETGGEPVEWGCQTTINDVTPDTLRAMAQAGCSYIYFGVESAEPDNVAVQKVRQLRVLATPVDWATRFREVAHLCRDLGIRVGTSLQFGLGETERQRLNTLDLIAELHGSGCIPDGCVALNINSPYPGTGQWLEMIHSGAELPDYRVKLERHPGFETAHQFSSIGPAEAEELYRLAAGRLGAAIHASE